MFLDQSTRGCLNDHVGLSRFCSKGLVVKGLVMAVNPRSGCAAAQLQ